MLASFPGGRRRVFLPDIRAVLAAAEEGLGVMGLYSLQGQGVVMLAGLTVPDKVAALLAQSQQVLRIPPGDGSMIPSGEKREGQNSRTGLPQLTP